MRFLPKSGRLAALFLLFGFLNACTQTAVSSYDGSLGTSFTSGLTESQRKAKILAARKRAARKRVERRKAFRQKLAKRREARAKRRDARAKRRETRRKARLKQRSASRSRKATKRKAQRRTARRTTRKTTRAAKTSRRSALKTKKVRKRKARKARSLKKRRRVRKRRSVAKPKRRKAAIATSKKRRISKGKKRRAPRRKAAFVGGRSRGVTVNAPWKCVPGRLKSVINQISRKFGRVVVNSTYRNRRRNRLVGGKRRSYHLRCQAIDFRVHGRTRGLLRWLARHPKVGGYKRYRSGFFHIDTGPKRSW